ncbi:hypothetical protein ALC56_09867 [Trachymyrmex septentrionalis]|uniref:Uncharacterized protein n=1 Tax=Trachymyrmex septentrionalis TaxID=34720 RepID=A0A151JUJ2_9HYME|nr:hypothetical protein ALC56_09867 [Trachymyrmex septentrionalis]
MTATVISLCPEQHLDHTTDQRLTRKFYKLCPEWYNVPKLMVEESSLLRILELLDQELFRLIFLKSFNNAFKCCSYICKISNSSSYNKIARIESELSFLDRFEPILETFNARIVEFNVVLQCLGDVEDANRLTDGLSADLVAMAPRPCKPAHP